MGNVVEDSDGGGGETRVKLTDETEKVVVEVAVVEKEKGAVEMTAAAEVCVVGLQEGEEGLCV